MSRLRALLAASAFAGTGLFAQAPAPAVPNPATYPGLFQADAPSKGDAARLISEIGEHQQAVANLQEMCDTIGSRLTGSEQLRKAQAWAVDKLKGYGAVNVHEEAYEFGKAWTRGTETARLLNANGQRLLVAQVAWTPATAGKVKGEVVLLQAKTPEELKAFVGHLSGAIVLLGDLPRGASLSEEQRKAMKEIRTQLMQEKPLATLRSSEKQEDKLTMAGGPGENLGVAGPVALIGNEHANLLKRLIAKGIKPQLELELGGTFSEQPVKAYNVVADIKGSEKPDEIVIVGGHQDSWDLGTGATDNGTGTVVAMETLRAISALGLKPKRTLRVILFSGEEQGLLGSEAYAKDHAKELDKLQAVLIDDLGEGRIKGWTLEGREDLKPALAAAMAPAGSVGCNELPEISIPDSSDHWPFEKQGVPAFFAFQDFADYFSSTHHSQLDTFDHVVPADLVQGCQAVAVTAWGLLNGERLPHAAPKKD